MRHLTGAFVGVTLAALASCTGDRERRSGGATASTSEIVELQASGAIVTRREPQAHLDRARSTFSTHDLPTSAAELREAAEFLRGERAGAGHQVSAELARSADDLAALATRVERGIVKSARELDHVFTAVHTVEAAYHHRRAAAAWTWRHADRTGEELLFAIDHLERAARDAQRARGGDRSALIAEARDVTAYLLSGIGWRPGEVDRTIEAVGRAIDEDRAELRRGVRGGDG